MNSQSSQNTTEAFAEETCPKCKGTGRQNWSARDGGKCWSCNGYGTILIDLEAIASFKQAK